MADVVSNQATVGKPARISYLFMLGTLVLVGFLHLTTPLLVAFFSYLALTKLHFVKRGGKRLAVALFVILVSAVVYSLGNFINHTIRALPEIADKAIPSVIAWARRYQIELTFTDYDSLKDMAFDTVTSQVNHLGSVARFARGATTQFVFVLVGSVVAISIFLNPRLELDREKYAVQDNLYSLCCDHIAQRFQALYQSFATVIGAQIVISAINTVFTSIFVLPWACPTRWWWSDNVSSRADPGAGQSGQQHDYRRHWVYPAPAKMALTALMFLVVIHKLEYSSIARSLAGAFAIRCG